MEQVKHLMGTNLGINDAIITFALLIAVNNRHQVTQAFMFGCATMFGVASLLTQICLKLGTQLRVLLKEFPLHLC